MAFGRRLKMKTWDEAIADFKKDNNFRSNEKSCGNCRHFGWGGCDDTICEHPDLLCRDCLGHDGIAYFPIQADNICDLWEDERTY
jgi:hypothetical protein